MKTAIVFSFLLSAVSVASADPVPTIPVENVCGIPVASDGDIFLESTIIDGEAVEDVHLYAPSMELYQALVQAYQTAQANGLTICASGAYAEFGNTIAITSVGAVAL